MLRNLAANALGRFWSVLANYLFIPVYIRLLGIESYAIISFSLVLVALTAALDAGMTATLTREFADRRRDDGGRIGLLMTLESVYVVLGLVMIAMFLGTAGWLARDWLRLEDVSPEQVAVYLRVAGVGIAFQMIANFYVGGLIGLERHVAANAYQVGWGVARSAVVVLPLMIWPSALVFFAWQTATTVVYALLVRRQLLRRLGRPGFRFRFRIDPATLRSVGAFAGGMLAVALVASVNGQLDRLVLSRMLSVLELGYYMVAVALAQGLLTLMSPVGTVMLPRFAQLYSSGEVDRAASLYATTLRASAILIGAAAMTLCFHAEAVLYAWTGNADLVGRTAPVLPYVASGTALLALQVVPFAVAIGNAYTRINVVMAVVAVTAALPAYVMAVGRFGMMGAAVVWMTLQGVVTPIYLALVHRRFLPGRLSAGQYLRILVVPIGVAAGVSLLLRPLTPEAAGRGVLLLWVMVVAVVVLGTTGMLLPTAQRRMVLSWPRAGGAS